MISNETNVITGLKKCENQVFCKGQKIILFSLFDTVHRYWCEDVSVFIINGTFEFELVHYTYRNQGVRKECTLCQNWKTIIVVGCNRNVMSGGLDLIQFKERKAVSLPLLVNRI